MKRLICLLLILVSLSGCSLKIIDNTTSNTNTDNNNTSSFITNSNTAIESETDTSSVTSTPEQDTSSNNSTTTNSQSGITVPSHSSYYVNGVTANDMVYYFNDVCFGNEFWDDKNILTKWYDPILFYINGNPTSEDYRILTDFINFLNNIDGFPGIRQVSNKSHANLIINFCNLETMNLYSPELNADGFATFNYITATGVITDGGVYIRNDINQALRSSVILEELYQVLGPTTDTLIRQDSIIYQYGDVLELSAIDKSIISMLYNPNMSHSMNNAQTENIIKQIYY